MLLPDLASRYPHSHNPNPSSPVPISLHLQWPIPFLQIASHCLHALIQHPNSLAPHLPLLSSASSLSCISQAAPTLFFYIPIHPFSSPLPQPPMPTADELLIADSSSPNKLQQSHVPSPPLALSLLSLPLSLNGDPILLSLHLSFSLHLFSLYKYIYYKKEKQKKEEKKKEEKK